MLVFAYVQIRGEAFFGEERDEANQILQSIARRRAAAMLSLAGPCVHLPRRVLTRILSSLIVLASYLIVLDVSAGYGAASLSQRAC